MARSRILTDFGAAREAAVMTALGGTGIRVPRLGAFDAANGQLLIERIEGSALVHRAPPAERLAAVTDYAGQLAALHALDWSTLDLGDAIGVPASSREMAVGGWLRSAEADAATAHPRLRHAEPLLRLLVRWLHDTVPARRGVEHLRMLHGDAGVTNFLSVEGRVTALVDWELAVVGDPMSDLGNARYREALYPTGTYADLVRAYETAAGMRIDTAAVGYYTVLASTVLSLGMVANTHHPRARQPEAVARLWQDALARSVACEAVCEVEGIALDYGDPVQGGSSFDPVLELLVDRLDTAAAADGTEHGYAQLARAVQNATRSGSAVDSALRDEVAELTGRSTGSVDDARAELAGLVDDAAAGQRNRLLVVLARDARRRLEVLSPLRDAEVWEGAAPGVTVATPRYVLPVMGRPAVRVRATMSDVLLSVDGAVATIRLTRPAKRNAITTAMYAELARFLTALGADPAVRVVALTGSGGSFTAGNDLADMQANDDLGADSPPRRFLDALVELPQVLVVGVDGPAIGIGTTVLLHADLVYATRTSVFAVPFVALGLLPEAASTLLLPALVGHARAAAMMLAGERVDAARAEQWGLVSGLVDGGQAELDDHLRDVTAALAGAPPAALAHTRRLLRAHRIGATRDRLAEDGALMAALADRLEGSRS